MKFKVDRKLLMILIILLLSSLLGVGYYIFYGSQYVGMVGVEKITKEEFNFISKFVQREMEQSFRLESNDLRMIFWDSTKLNNLKEVKLATLEYLQKFKIQYMDAKSQGVRLSEKDIFKIKLMIDKSIEKVGGDKSFEVYFGVSEKEAKSILKELLLVYKYAKDKQNKENISEPQLIDEYIKFPDEYDQVTIYSIYLEMPISKDSLEKDKIESIKDALQVKAKEILEMLKKEDDIENMIQQYSQDPGFEKDRGIFKITKNSNYINEIKEWAFSSSIGECGVIQTTKGIYILKFKNRTQFSDVKNKVLEQLRLKRHIDEIEAKAEEEKYQIKDIDKNFLNKFKVY